MELREYNYKAPQFLRKLRKLLKRDGTLIHGAFQRSVILTRKGLPRQHAITRIDLYADGKEFEKDDKRYEQIRFIAEHLSLEKLISRLRRLQKLKLTTGTTSINFPNVPSFHNDYYPRNNEFSDWPGTLFSIGLESPYLSSDTLSAPNLPTQETEYGAVGDFLGFSRFDSHDGRIGKILLFVPNYNGRIEKLAIDNGILTIDLRTAAPLEELVLEVIWSDNNLKRRKEILPKSGSESVILGFSPHTLHIWLKSKHGYFLDFHSENLYWSNGVAAVLPKAKPENAGILGHPISARGFTPAGDVGILSSSDSEDVSEDNPFMSETFDLPRSLSNPTGGGIGDEGTVTGKSEHGAGTPPRVFVSYSWETEDHRLWVSNFATRLQAEGGIEVVFDQWDLVPGKDKNLFMEGSIAEVDFVVLVCTPQYANRANTRIGGVGYEAMIITSELAETISKSKFIPVLRDGDFQASLPCWIKTKVGVDLRGDPYSDVEYQRLVRTLHRQLPARPQIGPKPQWSSDPTIANGMRAGLPGFRESRHDETDQERWDEAARLAKGMVLEGQNPISVERNGDSPLVMISSFGAYFNDKSASVYYNSGSIGGLTAGLRYYIFLEDINRSGGPVTYRATTIRKDALAGAEKVYIGSVFLKK